jgi:hypothetical protein
MTCESNAVFRFLSGVSGCLDGACVVFMLCLACGDCAEEQGFQDWDGDGSAPVSIKWFAVLITWVVWVMRWDVLLVRKCIG